MDNLINELTEVISLIESGNTSQAVEDLTTMIDDIILVACESDNELLISSSDIYFNA